MFAHYFRQASRMARSEPLFASLYITGVAVAVAAVMILSLILFSRLAPSYPEYNRSRTVYLTTVSASHSSGVSLTAGLSYPLYSEWTRDLPGVEHKAAVEENGLEAVSLPGKDIIGKVRTLQTDGGYFKIYPFDFIVGGPISPQDFETAAKKVVITDRLAAKLFGSPEEALGKVVEVSFKPFTVCGVVKGASPSASMSHFEAFYPLSIDPGWDRSGYFGYGGVLTLKPGASLEELRHVLQQRVSLPAKSHPMGGTDGSEWEYKINNQPITHYEYTFEPDGMSDDESSSPHYIGYYIIVALVLMIVPALNLSGLIVGRVDRRSSELGIRMSFGATKRALLWQIFSENLLLTMVGSILGLLIAWGAVYANSNWIFSILDSWVSDRPGCVSGTVNPGSFFSPWVFLITVGVTLVLNTLSSLLPAWFGLRRPIVQSINEMR